MDRSFSSLPIWFRRWGVGAWLLVGMVLVLIGAVWLLGKTGAIVDPLIAGFLFAAVAGVLVDRLESHGVSRGAGAGLLVLGVIVLGVLVVVLVLVGISSEAPQISAAMSSALSKVQHWAEALGSTRHRRPPAMSRTTCRPSGTPCSSGSSTGSRA